MASVLVPPLIDDSTSTGLAARCTPSLSVRAKAPRGHDNFKNRSPVGEIGTSRTCVAGCGHNTVRRCYVFPAPTPYGERRRLHARRRAHAPRPRRWSLCARASLPETRAAQVRGRIEQSLLDSSHQTCLRDLEIANRGRIARRDHLHAERRYHGACHRGTSGGLSSHDESAILRAALRMLDDEILWAIALS